jgi:uncharacterized membrane protein
MSRSRDITALAALFATSGTLHFVVPGLFEQIVPRALARRRELVHASGAAELACAAALLHPRTRRVGGRASAWLLVAVFPANLQMALDARRSNSTAYRAGTLVRLPLQWPMIRTARRAARG